VDGPRGTDSHGDGDGDGGWICATEAAGPGQKPTLALVPGQMEQRWTATEEHSIVVGSVRLASHSEPGNDPTTLGMSSP